MKKHLFLISTLAVLLAVQSCANNDKKNQTNIHQNEVIMIPRSDTIKLGELYGTEIHVPNYDSSYSYSCLIGNYEKKEIKGDTILQMVSQYDSLIQSRILGIYYLQTKPSRIGKLSYQGYIKAKKEDETIYYPFKNSLYVISPPNIPQE